MVGAMTQVDPLPHGADVALRGLELAHGRLRQGVKKYARGDGGALVVIALSEALYWIAALDDHGFNHVSDYSQNRDSFPGGHTVAGLVYAQCFHAHELISTREAAIGVGDPGDESLISDPPGSGAMLETQPRWTALQDLPAPRRPQRRGSGQMYDEMVAEWPLTQPIAYARAWLESILL